ncbi:VIT and VWA domain-containing protein [Myxococcota bacterium]|nr:VIT and VWA domain-containing protein [Myxococcota bacterium]
MTQPLRAVDLLPSSPSAPSRGLGGLLALSAGAERPFPLLGVKARASIVGPCARTVIEQRFHNPLTVTLDVVHIFPLPEDGAVIEVELVCGDLVVRAECQEREQAAARFAEAQAAGHRAALLSRERDDVHTLRVTNLPPGEEVRVRIVVVERLDSVDGRFVWRLPTTIPPRYLPGEAVGHSGPGVSPDTTAVPDASRLQPPISLGNGAPLDLEVTIAGPLFALESSLHAVSMALDGGGARVAPSASARCDRDFVLHVSTADSKALTPRAWTDGAFTLAVMEPPGAALAPQIPRDAVFLIDISGSMEGVKLDAAKRAVIAAVHGLMPGDRFQLIAFDDRVEVQHRSFTEVTDDSLRKADAWVGRLRARGGTEMLPALQAGFSLPPIAGRLRTVLFITDGQAWNEGELVAAVANRRQGALLFTLGIDTAAAGALLKKLARAGGGTCELLTPHEDVEAAVARLEARFGSPLITNLVAEGRVSARPEPQVVFAGRPAALLVEGDGPITLRGDDPSGERRVTLTPTRSPMPLGALWGRERIAALEDRLAVRPFEEEAILPELRRVALAHHLASRCTSFVAVETGRVVTGPKAEIVQPQALPMGWSEALAAAPMPPPMMPAPGGAPARSQVAAAPAMMDFMPAEPNDDDSVDMMSAGLAQADAEELAPMKELRRAAPKRQKSAAPPPAPRPAPASQMAKREELAPAAPQEAPDARLAQTQGADGHFGHDPRRTAAALLVLILCGSTRFKGLRRRAVAKAAAALEPHRALPEVSLALDALVAAESGATATPSAAWRSLTSAGPEGAALAGLLR